jgi:hypothetical protein
LNSNKEEDLPTHKTTKKRTKAKELELQQRRDLPTHKTTKKRTKAVKGGDGKPERLKEWPWTPCCHHLSMEGRS